MQSTKLVAFVATVMLAAACGGGDDVRSGDGPAARSDDTNEAPTTTETVDDADGAAEQATTTTTAPVADPSTSPALAVVGNVAVPDGDEGELAVVVGTADVDDYGATVPVVVRNRTDATVYDVEASGTARGGDGALAGSGRSQGFAPTTVEPGEWAVGFLYFDSSLPAGATFDVTATASDEAGFISSVDVRPIETNTSQAEFSGTQVIGIVENPTNAVVAGPVSVLVTCFDGAGTTPTSAHRGHTDADSIAAGGTASFTVDLFDAACPNFVVGASGYDS